MVRIEVTLERHAEGVANSSAVGKPNAHGKAAENPGVRKR